MPRYRLSPPTRLTIRDGEMASVKGLDDFEHWKSGCDKNHKPSVAKINVRQCNGRIVKVYSRRRTESNSHAVEFSEWHDPGKLYIFAAACVSIKFANPRLMRD